MWLVSLSRTDTDREVQQHRDRLRRLERDLEKALSMSDIGYSEGEVKSTYGDTVSVSDKSKSLNKFGTNETVGTALETVGHFQGTTANETYVSTNLIDGISSSAAGDTGLVFVVEGHTIDGSGNLTFVSQDATLDGSDGRTKVVLATPMARANRMYLKDSGTFDSPQTEPTGTVYVYDDTDGITAGVPDTAAATKILVDPGEAQSRKCATSISSADYWFVSFFGADIGESGGNASYVTVILEIRDVENGGVWRPLGREIVLVVGQTGVHLEFSPYLIVPKNHDVRVRADSDSNTAAVEAEIGGYLAKIV